MGAALSYVAVKTKPSSDVLEPLKITALKSSADVFGFYGSDGLFGLEDEHGWFIIYNYSDPRNLLAPAILKKLSTNNRLVACEVEEHVMCSATSGWINGEQVWKVDYDSQTDEERVVTTGQMPGGYDEMAAALKADSPSPDVGTLFAIPTELMHNICGREYLDNELFPRFKIDF